ncbi:MAG: hypothetical protein NVS3B26_19670 [Mycobacteriales bacterium]
MHSRQAEQKRVLALGAALHTDFIGPEGYGWQVHTDPVGHPFCLCRHEGVTWIDNRVAWPSPCACPYGTDGAVPAASSVLSDPGRTPTLSRCLSRHP